jgi:hypothetical protein
LIKEEGNNEYDLLFSAAELLGCLFKTHRPLVGNIVQHLRATTLNQAFGSGVQKRMKLGLYILDDFIEFLGSSYFSQEDYTVIVKTICNFAGNKSASIRQAAAYGIGVIAQHGGAAFAFHS